MFVVPHASMDLAVQLPTFGQVFVPESTAPITPTSRFVGQAITVPAAQSADQLIAAPSRMLTAARVAAETVVASATLKRKRQCSHVVHGGEATAVLDVSVARSSTRPPLWVANEDSPRDEG
jgi:hypothetical protein